MWCFKFISNIYIIFSKSLHSDLIRSCIPNLFFQILCTCNEFLLFEMILKSICYEFVRLRIYSQFLSHNLQGFSAVCNYIQIDFFKISALAMNLCCLKDFSKLIFLNCVRYIINSLQMQKFIFYFF